MPGGGEVGVAAGGARRACVTGPNPATDDGARVISMSLGGSGDPDDPMSQAVDSATAAGVAVVIAAGNSGPSERSIGSPGTARSAITVGASDKSDAMAGFSSRGPVVWPGGAILKPDIVAPGVAICSTRWGTAWPGHDCIDSNHSSLSGTSMATPHVAGVAALLLQLHPLWTPAQVKTALRDTALDLAQPATTQGYRSRTRVGRGATVARAPGRVDQHVRYAERAHQHHRDCYEQHLSELQPLHRIRAQPLDLDSGGIFDKPCDGRRPRSGLRPGAEDRRLLRAASCRNGHQQSLK